ncbi:MAG: hypothetical protein ACUZ8H_10570 [Candidatus Anammoxibacter sp.]
MRTRILKHLLTWFKERFLNLECTRERSNIVDSVDYLLENLKHANI